MTTKSNDASKKLISLRRSKWQNFHEGGWR